MTTLEVHQREIKAAKIVRMFEQFNITADEVATGCDLDWQLVATLAKVALPSAETRRVVMEIMRTREGMNETRRVG